MSTMTTSKLAAIVARYLELFPEEQGGLQGLHMHAGQGDNTIFSRKNAIGHITGAGFIVARDTGRVLLIEHKILQRFLQPGGHFEPTDDDVLATARREIEEETGLGETDLTYVPFKVDQPLMPFEIDVHHIPANPNKQEFDHDHYDFRYLFVVPHEAVVQFNTEELTGYQWFDIAAFKQLDATFPRVAEKINTLLKSR
jgi:8-oxo-dGTP pyrophosphatase MutT (NUDIX family)